MKIFIYLLFTLIPLHLFAKNAKEWIQAVEASIGKQESAKASYYGSLSKLKKIEFLQDILRTHPESGVREIDICTLILPEPFQRPPKS